MLVLKHIVQTYGVNLVCLRDTDVIFICQFVVNLLQFFVPYYDMQRHPKAAADGAGKLRHGNIS